MGAFIHAHTLVHIDETKRGAGCGGTKGCRYPHLYLRICICAPGSGAFVYLNLRWAQCDHLIWIRVWHGRRQKIKQRITRIQMRMDHLNIYVVAVYFSRCSFAFASEIG